MRADNEQVNIPIFNYVFELIADCTTSEDALNPQVADVLTLNHLA
jgi:hypothetical protein